MSIQITPENRQTEEISRTNSAGTPSEVRNAVQSNKIDTRPAFDQYIPEKSNEQDSYGHYKMVSDENGNQKIQFSAPAKNPDESGKEAPDAEISGRDNSKNSQKIQKLNKKRQQIKQQLITETDPQKTEQLKKKLAQIETQLKSKAKLNM